jgi:hypothetical protein
MVIEDLQALHAQAGSPLVEVNLDGVVFHLDHPEHVVRVNVHVEVVNLLREVGRSSRTGVQVKSNKGECTPMGLTVSTDELAPSKAHVRSER